MSEKHPTQLHAAQPSAEATSKQLDNDAETIDTIRLRIARLANSPEMQAGQIPERLGKAAIWLEDARDLIRAARREWNALD